MKIPYGMSSFADIRREGYFYVDKTPFLPVLERAESGYRYLLFLRPRRIGKSLLLSMMQQYYDIGRKEEFDELFGGLWVHRHPTPERNRYLVLTLDFSQVATDRGQEALQRTFLEVVRGGVEALILTRRALVPELDRLDARLDTYRDAEALMAALLRLVGAVGQKLYVLIDEYDNFANRLLSDGAQDLYESIVQRTGFVRSFYATLKAGTLEGVIARMFVTGVSPILLDDLSSGFNIVKQVSQHPAFDTIAGFTRSDVERAVDEFLSARSYLAGWPELTDRDRLLALLEQYYDGYRFSGHASERMFNSDMVLYFLSEIENQRAFPSTMLDLNVRTDYQRLVRIGMLTGTAGAARRELLETILADGHVTSPLVHQFGARSLSSREQFISLLYYLGMLTIGAEPPTAEGYRLEIPNRVIRELQWEHLAILLKDQEQIDLDASELKAALTIMAVQGEIQPFLDLFHSRVLRKLGVKDLRQFSEKTLKLMLMTYISLSPAFHVLSEKELAQGYCDLFLGASRRVASARYAWLLELKYLPTAAKPARIEAAFAEAEQQVARYASDAELLPLLTDGRELKAGSLVFVGMKKALFRPWPPERRAAPARKPRAAARRPGRKAK